MRCRKTWRLELIAEVLCNRADSYLMDRTDIIRLAGLIMLMDLITLMILMALLGLMDLRALMVLIIVTDLIRIMALTFLIDLIAHVNVYWLNGSTKDTIHDLNSAFFKQKKQAHQLYCLEPK